jgi:hypothetical protein
MRGLGLLAFGKKDVVFILFNAVRIAPEATFVHESQRETA